MGGLCSVDQDGVKKANLQEYDQPRPVPADAPSAVGPEEYKLENIRKRLGLPPDGVSTINGPTREDPLVVTAETSTDDPLIREFDAALDRGDVPLTQAEETRDQKKPPKVASTLPTHQDASVCPISDTSAIQANVRLPDPAVKLNHTKEPSHKEHPREQKADDPLYRAFEEHAAAKEEEEALKDTLKMMDEDDAHNQSFKSATSSPERLSDNDHSPLRNSESDLKDQVKRNLESRKGRLSGRDKLSETFPVRPKPKRRSRNYSPSKGPIDGEKLYQRAENARVSLSPTPPTSPEPTTPNGRYKSGL